MKAGYSILLGEMIDSKVVQYKDCEAFQIVCPSCREPIFKAMRNAADTETIHYLSHYSRGAAYQSDCELRVNGMIAQGFDQQNFESRNQRLQYFLEKLKVMLGMSPLYTSTLDDSHRRLRESKNLQKLKSMIFEMVIAPDVAGFFDTAADDYIYRLDKDGWALSTSFSKDQQIRIAKDMWMTINSPAGKPNLSLLFDHAYVSTMAGYISGHEAYRDVVSKTIVEFMDRVVRTSTKHLDDLMYQMAATLIPVNFNKVRGEEDEEQSSYLERIFGSVAIEMVGALITLPYREMLMQKYNDPSKIYEMTAGIEPATDEAKALMAARSKSAEGH